MPLDAELKLRDEKYFLSAKIPDPLLEDMSGTIIEIPLETSNIAIAQDRFFIEKIKLEKEFKDKQKQHEPYSLNNAFTNDIKSICSKVFKDKVGELLQTNDDIQNLLKPWEDGLYTPIKRSTF